MGGPIVCLNGNFVPENQAVVPAVDRAFLFGYGLFETIAVRDGQMALLSRHLRRLTDGCALLDMPSPWTAGQLAALAAETIERNRVKSGALRLTWSAGSEELGGNLLITVRPLPYGPEHYRRGFRVCVAESRRNETSSLTRVKTLNYLENLLARQKARVQGLDEVLFRNMAGYLAEASAGNVFFIRGNQLVTPSVEQGLLPGIMRGLVLELARYAGLKPLERPVALDELFTADEVFLTNSLMGVMPLVEVAGHAVANGSPGVATARLGRLVEESVLAAAGGNITLTRGYTIA